MTIGATALDEMTDGYIRAALWADCQPMCTCEGEGEGGHGTSCAIHESGGLEALSVSPDDWLYVRALCEAFVEAARDHLTTFARLRSCEAAEGSIWHHIGHDLRLTSGGHGTGFWDREARTARLRDSSDTSAFERARDYLSNLAGERPFDRTGGGDVWQESEILARFDPTALNPEADPGDRWKAPDLTSAQRQCWIDTGRVPPVAETFPAGDVLSFHCPMCGADLPEEARGNVTPELCGICEDPANREGDADGEAFDRMMAAGLELTRDDQGRCYVSGAADYTLGPFSSWSEAARNPVISPSRLRESAEDLLAALDCSEPHADDWINRAIADLRDALDREAS